MDIYEDNFKLVGNSPMDPFSFLKKWFYVLTIVIWPKDIIFSISSDLPDGLFNCISLCTSLHQIDFFNCQKKSSTGANSGEYWRRKRHIIVSLWDNSSCEMIDELEIFQL